MSANKKTADDLVDEGFLSYHKKDFKSALKLFREARSMKEGSTARAQFALAMLYEKGDGVKKNKEKANRLYAEIIENAENEDAHPSIIYVASKMYFAANGEYGQCEQKPEKAFELLKKASLEKNYCYAQYEFACLLENKVKNNGVEDFALVRFFYKEAAEQGLALAQFRLGFLCANGLGEENGESNYAAAVSWYKEAAKKNEINALYHLGEMFKEGLYVEKDFKEARNYFERAVRHGDSYAKDKLAELDSLQYPASSENASIGGALFCGACYLAYAQNFSFLNATVCMLFMSSGFFVVRAATSTGKDIVNTAYSFFKNIEDTTKTGIKDIGTVLKDKDLKPIVNININRCCIS